jgi:outer membrane receptor protein involved in Fe transport
LRQRRNLAWGLVLLSAPGLAQSPAPADPDTIIVTGSLFRFQSASETPQSVTTLGREVLDQRLALSVEETLRYVPSVQPDLAPGRGFDEFLIRGFNQSRYQFRDGLRLDPGYLQQQEVHGLERIEVLKGPASVLFGQIAPGGLVNSVSKLPGTEFAASGALTAGSFGLWRITADINAAAGGRWRAVRPCPRRLADAGQPHRFRVGRSVVRGPHAPVEARPGHQPRRPVPVSGGSLRPHAGPSHQRVVEPQPGWAHR